MIALLFFLAKIGFALLGIYILGMFAFGILGLLLALVGKIDA